MATPQQPDLRRGRRAPEENRPGHRPPVDQDKPTGPPQLPPRHHHFDFVRDDPMALAGLPFGVTTSTAFVDVDDERLVVRFGPWHLRTPIENVASAEVTGPYRWWKVIGPPHLSFADRGVTFATTARQGVCIRFEEPVAVLLPSGVLRHPSVTVTVDEPEELVRFLQR